MASSSHVSKRRRLENDECEVVRQIERDASDIRASLQELHRQVDTFGDIVIVVQGENSSREFPCVSALLASASRPLAAMLYGPMRAATPAIGTEKRPRLHLSMTEPWCFEQLLHYVHGVHIGARPPIRTAFGAARGARLRVPGSQEGKPSCRAPTTVSLSPRSLER